MDVKCWRKIYFLVFTAYNCMIQYEIRGTWRKINYHESKVPIHARRIYKKSHARIPLKLSQSQASTRSLLEDRSYDDIYLPVEGIHPRTPKLQPIPYYRGEGGRDNFLAEGVLYPPFSWFKRSVSQDFSVWIDLGLYKNL